MLRTLEEHLREPEEYYPEPPLTPLEPLRLSSISSATFEHYARRGIPIIVTDTARDWPMRNWTCDSVRQDFAKEKMRREYDGTNTHATNNQLIGDEDWKSQVAPNGEEEVSKGPLFAPWYWDVKDGPAYLKQKIKEFTRLPYFMENTYLNYASQNDSAEFWMSAPGAGAKAHADEHCESTMSVQLSGVKRWRLGPMPAVTHLRKRKSLNDGAMSRHGNWAPVYVFDLLPGEGLFFPPGFVHETSNVGKECAISVTYQWDFPAPTTYVRAFLPRMFFTEEMNECDGRWSAYNTLVPQNSEVDKSSLPGLIDSNADGIISMDELTSWFHDKKHWGDKYLQYRFLDGPYERSKVLKEIRGTLIRDSLQFLDANNDSMVTTSEYALALERFQALQSVSARYKRSIKRFNTLMEKHESCERPDDVLNSISDAYPGDPQPEAMAALSDGCQALLRAYLSELQALERLPLCPFCESRDSSEL